MKKQKGQILIEFALILPFFLLFVFGIIYCGMMFYDYSQLQNVARQAARERATHSMELTNEEIRSHYFDDDTYKYKTAFMTNMYRPAQSRPLEISMEGTNAMVEINAVLSAHAPIVEQVAAKQFRIIYQMKKDVDEPSDG